MKKLKISEDFLADLRAKGYNALFRDWSNNDNDVHWTAGKTTVEKCQQLNSHADIERNCVGIDECLEEPEVFGVGGYIIISPELEQFYYMMQDQ